MPLEFSVDIHVHLYWVHMFCVKHNRRFVILWVYLLNQCTEGIRYWSAKLSNFLQLRLTDGVACYSYLKPLIYTFEWCGIVKQMTGRFLHNLSWVSFHISLMYVYVQPKLILQWELPPGKRKPSSSSTPWNHRGTLKQPNTHIESG